MQEIQGLLDSLKNGDWWARKRCISKLLAHPEALYLPVLEQWLRNGDDALLRNASMEIYKALGRRSIDSLISLLQDLDGEVRIFAANVLGDIGDNACFDSLAKALDDPDIRVRHAAAEALGKIADERANDALARKIQDVPWVAMAAIAALGDIGGERAVDILHSCLDSEEYRGIACCALERAGDIRSVEFLGRFLGKDPVGELALKAAVNICQKNGTSLPSSYLGHLIPVLMDLQCSPKEEIRKSAFIALSWASDARAAPYLISALQDQELQEYAVNGLILLGSRAEPYLTGSLQNPGQQRVILAKILSMSGEYQSLLFFADDYDSEVRTEAALAIGHLNSPDAEKTLQKLLLDQVEEVRAAAGISMKLLKGRKEN